jgi:Icc-related predicted phosphoesterase
VATTNKSRRREWEANADDDKEAYEAITSLVSEDIEAYERNNRELYVHLGEDLFARLHIGARMGLKVKELPAFCGIRMTKMERLLEKYPLLRGQLDVWAQDIIAKAKTNLWKSVDDGDVDTSKWVLERLSKDEYAKTQTVDVRKVSIGFNGGSVATIEALKAARDKIYSSMGKNDGEEIVRTITVDGGRMVGGETIDVSEKDGFKIIGVEELEDKDGGERDKIKPLSESKE